MITALLGILIAQLAGISGLKFWTRRTQKQAELRRWAPFRQNPVIDPLLRKYAGQPTLSKPTRWAANRFKSTARNFVNSESFSIAVDALANTESPVWQLKDKLPAALRFGNAKTTTKLGGLLQPAEPSSCTIL